MAKSKSYKSPFPERIPAMLATIVKEPFTDPDWLFEIKWDGCRIVAEVRNGKAVLYSQEGQDYTDKYRLIVNEFEGQPDLVVDGVIVVLDDNGIPDISALQHYNGRGDLVYYIFDLLYYDGENYIERPLIQRKEMLLHVIKKESILTYSDHFDDGKALFDQIKLLGLEGVIAKRKESIYQPGKRSKDWLHIKISIRRKNKKPENIIPDIYNDVIKEIEQVREKKLRNGR
jgi:bifunctional non-homologous end joining protein LigD